MYRSKLSRICSIARVMKLASWSSRICLVFLRTATDLPTPHSRPNSNDSSRYSSMSTRATRPLSSGYVIFPVRCLSQLTMLQVIYNESWGQLRGPPYPEEKLTEVVRKIDPSRLIDSVTGWNDHGFGDFSVRPPNLPVDRN